MLFTQIENLVSFNILFAVKDMNILKTSNCVTYIMEKYHVMVGVKPDMNSIVKYSVGFENFFKKYLANWMYKDSDVVFTYDKNTTYNYEEIKRVYYYLYKNAWLNKHKKFYPNLIIDNFKSNIGSISDIQSNSRKFLLHVLMRELVDQYIKFHGRYLKSLLIVENL